MEERPVSLTVPAVVRRGSDPDALAPDGSEIRLLAGAAQGIAGASLCEVTLPAGQVSRPVYHRQVEEVWYVLNGAGQVWRCPPGAGVDELPPTSVAPGDCLTIPVGWRFQFSASPESALRFLCFTVPAWPGPDEAVPAGEGGLGAPTV